MVCHSVCRFEGVWKFSLVARASVSLQALREPQKKHRLSKPFSFPHNQQPTSSRRQSSDHTSKCRRPTKVFLHCRGVESTAVLALCANITSRTGVYTHTTPSLLRLQELWNRSFWGYKGIFCLARGVTVQYGLRSGWKSPAGGVHWKHTVWWVCDSR